MTSLLLEPPSSRPAQSPARRRLLLVAYCFPPVGGAGVQRPVKWVKYLERLGWDVTVLTPANPSVPALDESLLSEIPAGTRFVRPTTWEPDYRIKQQMAGQVLPTSRWWLSPQRWAGRLAHAAATVCLQPDPQILWYPNAVRAASRLLCETPHDAILCTAPPYSSFLIGRALKCRFGLPLILDYRDEWDLSSQYLEHAHRDRISKFVQERQQRLVLRAADAVVATTQASVDRLCERLRELKSSARCTCVYNGYDAEDFDRCGDEALTLPFSERFRLVYTGTLWNLTDATPVVAAIELLQQQTPELVQRLEFVCIGRKTPEQQLLLRRLAATDCSVVNWDYCDHAQVLQWLQAADALCLLLSDVPGADRVVPAKLFEYLAARRDLLAIAPPGETSNIISRYQSDGQFDPSDVPGICHWLQKRLSTEFSDTESANAPDIAEFSRERQTNCLADLLNALTSVSLVRRRS